MVKFNADGIGVIVIDDGKDKFAGNAVDVDCMVVEAVASSNFSDLTMSLCILSKCLPMCIFCFALYAQKGHWKRKNYSVKMLPMEQLVPKPGKMRIKSISSCSDTPK